MNEETKRKMIRNYFKKFPKWAVVLAVIGLLAFSGGKGGIVIGLILVGAGGFAIYSFANGKPTDQQMNEWLDEDLRALTPKALNKSGTDETELVREPEQIIGWRFDVNSAPFLYRKGKDNILRWSPVGVSVLSFTKDQLVGYQCALDLTTGNALNESTDEYFYKDVVSVATKTDSKQFNVPGIKGPVQMNAAESFTLTTSGGTGLSVLLRDPTLITKMGGGEIPATRAEKAIASVRKMLREKKAQ